MRNFLWMAMLLLLASCGSSASEDKNTGEKDHSNDPVYRQGLALVGKNKCLTCHAINETITGPPYKEIAKRYKDSGDTIVPHLAKKIISGGNGNWGAIYMTPHPDLSQQDAEAMVKYILLLAK